MALTTHPQSDHTNLDTDDLAPQVSPPAGTPSSRGIAGWMLALTGAAAAAVLAVVVVQSGSDTTAPASPTALIEQGSIRAIEGADSVVTAGTPPVVAHRQVVENGSVRAIEGAASAPAGGGSGNHALLLENGSIRAIDHADEARNG